VALWTRVAMAWVMDGQVHWMVSRKVHRVDWLPSFVSIAWSTMVVPIC